MKIDITDIKLEIQQNREEMRGGNNIMRELCELDRNELKNKTDRFKKSIRIRKTENSKQFETYKNRYGYQQRNI